jgi:schlafen family protein
MALYDLPFQSIAREHLEDVVARQMREGRRLDFKLTLTFDLRDSLVNFLRDVVAFANAEGGMLAYGIREGTGQEEGTAVEVVGMTGNADQLSNQIDGYLRNNIDERIPGVLHRPVSVGNDRFVYLVRVPPSPLAPHMIEEIRTLPGRFFVRANTSNEPMSARQIKEAARRGDTAIERASQIIQARVEELRRRARDRKNRFGTEELPCDQAILHLVPLFPGSGGWNYGDPAIAKQLLEVRAFGYIRGYEPLHYTQHGAFAIADDRHAGFLRRGALEFQQYDVLLRETSGQLHAPIFIASDVEAAIAEAMADAERLSDDGLLPVPLLIQLHLLGVGSSRFQATRAFGTRSSRCLEEDEVASEGMVLSDWSEGSTVLRELCNTIWQAWGLPSSRNYRDGAVVRFTADGRRVN